jgi:hypothetical protein
MQHDDIIMAQLKKRTNDSFNNNNIHATVIFIIQYDDVAIRSNGIDHQYILHYYKYMLIKISYASILIIRSQGHKPLFFSMKTK